MVGIAHGREVAMPFDQVDSIGCPLSFDFILYRVRGSLSEHLHGNLRFG